ncbi:cysteine desulfurase [Aureococcus anophagefferens]|nr:cysteine desulfurase [Aureococcus anophagefferens]
MALRTTLQNAASRGFRRSLYVRRAAPFSANAVAEEATPPYVLLPQDDASPARVASLLDAHGLVVIHDLVRGDALEHFSSSLREHTSEVLAACEGVPLGVGASFEEVVLVAGRYDVPHDFAALEKHGALDRVEALARAALGDDCERAFCGTVLARPGSPAQEWHADSLHESEAERPAQLLNVLVALDDIAVPMGPTELLPGSHQRTNHRAEARRHRPRFDEAIVYQHASHGPALLGMDEGPCWTRSWRARGGPLRCEPAEVVFGNNATSLVLRASRALARTWDAGDNIVLSSLDHDCNAGPWAWAARDAGVRVRWIPVKGDGCLDVDALEALVDARTRLVACGYASNGLGSVTDVSRVCGVARRAGAVSFVDAVHYAPHGLVDVALVGCDFLVLSPYKFFGPHCGALFGRRELLEALEPAKLRVADGGLPSDANCHMSKWEVGTQNFEALAGTTAAVDYLASLGDRFGGLAAGGRTRRERLVAGFGAIARHEHVLKRRFLAGAAKVPGLVVHGVADLGRLDERTCTFAVTKAGVDPERLTAALVDDHGVYCTYGNHYCTFWDDLGLDNATGATRLGFLHYNTAGDVDKALAALAAVE